MDNQTLQQAKKAYQRTAPNLPLHLIAEIERLQGIIASERDEARAEIDSLVTRLAKAVDNNDGLASDLLRAKGEMAGLRAQVATGQDVATRLAEVVYRYSALLDMIRPRVGNGIAAAIDDAMKGVELTKQPAGTLAEVVESGIEALFKDVAGMDGELSPLELFRAQQAMVNAWRGYVNGGGNGQS